MKPKTRSALLVVLAALAFSGGAAALPLFGKSKPGDAPGIGDGLVPQGREQRHNDPNPGLSAKEAARQAQSINGGGRVLSVDEATGGWRVKLLKEGNVRFVFVPD